MSLQESKILCLEGCAGLPDRPLVLIGPRSHLGLASASALQIALVSHSFPSALTWHSGFSLITQKHHRTTQEGWIRDGKSFIQQIFIQCCIVLVTGDTATNTPWFWASEIIIGIRQEYRNKYTDVDMCLKENFKRKGSERWWREGGYFINNKRFIWLTNTLSNKILGEMKAVFSSFCNEQALCNYLPQSFPETPILGISLFPLIAYSGRAHHSPEVSILKIWILVLPSRSLNFWRT